MYTTVVANAKIEEHPAMTHLASLASLESPAFWSALFGFEIESDPECSAKVLPIAEKDQPFVHLEGVANPYCDRFVHALRALEANGLPLPFLYVARAAFGPAEQLLAWASERFGQRYVLAEDAWAYLVPAGASGWPAHRGVSLDVRNEQGAPDVLNSWIALTDVEVTGSCMWFVHPKMDPGYPSGGWDAKVLEHGHPVPVNAGDALLWNANVLHWGGRSAPLAPVRASYTFTLVSESSAFAKSLRTMPVAPTFRQRLDVIAAQLLTYSTMTELSPRYLEWAKVTCALRR
jgi:Phytanoyl-CoA dioxygenase (PhyH)